MNIHFIFRVIIHCHLIYFVAQNVLGLAIRVSCNWLLLTYSHHCSICLLISSALPYRLALQNALKIVQTINSGENGEKREPFCTVGENVNWYSQNGKQYRDSLKTRNKSTI